MSVPKAGSPGEEAFALHCRVEGLVFVREYKFDPNRSWKFDFAFLKHKLAVEIEGGLYVNGGHSRGAAYEANLEKYNAAAMQGWTVLRYSTRMVKEGKAINNVLAVLTAAI